MLACIDSYELSEWMAFERAFGPIGSEYNDRALMAIHEQLLLLCRMFGEVNFESNPIGHPEKLRLPSPDEIYEKQNNGG